MSESRPCELCGRLGATTALVRYRDAADRWRYEAIVRCTDRERCRARVTEIGETYWPVDQVAAAER